jgi:DNA-binding beta-propeller fold protein YncE
VRILLSISLALIGTIPGALAAEGKAQPVPPAPPPAPAEPVKIAFPASGSARPVQFAASSGEASRLVKPFGVAVDVSGRVLVADPAHRAVVVYPREGPALQWKGNAHYPLVGPVAVAADRDGRVFAVDGYQAHVVVFDPAGAPTAIFGKGTLLRPEGIAIDSEAGRIYIGDVKAHKVFVFNLKTLKMESTIGGTAQVGFDSPGRLAVNSKGQLLVSDGWNCRVQILDATGALVRRFPTQCAKRGEFGRPHAIAVDATDRIYVVSPDDSSLQIFTPDGKPRQFFSSLGKAETPPALRTAITVDKDSRVYVVDQRSGEGRLRVFTLARSAAPASTSRGNR